MVICLERVADLHMLQLMPLPLTVSCFSKVQLSFIFLVPAHQGSPGQRAIKQVCVFVSVQNVYIAHVSLSVDTGHMSQVTVVLLLPVVFSPRSQHQKDNVAIRALYRWTLQSCQLTT